MLSIIELALRGSFSLKSDVMTIIWIAFIIPQRYCKAPALNMLKNIFVAKNVCKKLLEV